LAPHMLASQSKALKDSDDSLDSKKLSRKVAHWVATQDQVNSAQRWKHAPIVTLPREKPKRKKILAV